MVDDYGMRDQSTFASPLTPFGGISLTLGRAIFFVFCRRCPPHCYCFDIRTPTLMQCTLLCFFVIMLIAAASGVGCTIIVEFPRLV